MNIACLWILTKFDLLFSESSVFSEIVARSAQPTKKYALLHKKWVIHRYINLPFRTFASNHSSSLAPQAHYSILEHIHHPNTHYYTNMEFSNIGKHCDDPACKQLGIYHTIRLFYWFCGLHSLLPEPNSFHIKTNVFGFSLSQIKQISFHSNAIYATTPIVWTIALPKTTVVHTLPSKIIKLLFVLSARNPFPSPKDKIPTK